MTAQDIINYSYGELSSMRKDELDEIIRVGKSVSIKRIRRLQQSPYWNSSLVQDYNNNFLSLVNNINIKESTRNQSLSNAAYIKLHLESDLSSIKGQKEYEYSNIKSLAESISDITGRNISVRRTKDGFSINNMKYTREEISDFYSQVRNAWDNQSVAIQNAKSKYESERNFAEIASMVFLNQNDIDSLASDFIGTVLNRVNEINMQEAQREMENEARMEEIRNRGIGGRV